MPVNRHSISCYYKSQWPQKYIERFSVKLVDHKSTKNCFSFFQPNSQNVDWYLIYPERRFYSFLILLKFIFKEKVSLFRSTKSMAATLKRIQLWNWVTAMLWSMRLGSREFPSRNCPSDVTLSWNWQLTLPLEMKLSVSKLCTRHFWLPAESEIIVEEFYNQ